jgi:MFS family permease
VLGVWAACNGVAMAIGPTLGGLVIGGFGWRGIFLLVVPLSVAAWVLALRHIPESSDMDGRHLDLPAQLLGAAVLAGVALAAIELRDNPLLAGLAAVIAAVALMLFLQVEARRGASALVPLDLFGIRRFRAAVVTTFAMTFGMYGILFLLPLVWLETGRLNALAAGFALMPMALLFVVVSPFSGSVTQRFGDRVATSGGVAVIGCGLLLIAFGAGRQTLIPTEIGLALTGIGMGFATGPLMAVAVGAVSAGRAGTAGSLINVARMSGATIGVACLGALFAAGQGGATGLRLAMLAGGAVQIGSAFWAWRNTAA